MKYERLTQYQYQCNKCEKRRCTTNSFCIDRVDCNLYNRLAELEDKIERGELVENKVVTYINMARSDSKTLIDKAIKYDKLKDKIENGTLIETEYSIYQEVYFIDYVDENYYSVGAIKGKPTVRKAFIRSVEQVMKGQILYLIQPYDLPQEVIDNEVEHTETWEWFHYSKKNLFLTKAEAEQKLKELQK